ncbi:Uncharacterised protein [Corynebacterium renale]|nr:Uncharacterised protein [Corynebacterium renale]STC94489.1 Uncharacterised protein [Corynebacterium renale]
MCSGVRFKMPGMYVRPFHDRHGRGLRGPLTPTAVPSYRTRAELFDRAVLHAYAPLVARFPEQLAHVDLAVDTIPRMNLRADMPLFSDEIVADGPVPLGRILPAGVDSQGRPTRTRFVVFRMPIEQRCETAWERKDLLSLVVTALVASYLNVDPRTIKPDFEL